MWLCVILLLLLFGCGCCTFVIYYNKVAFTRLLLCSATLAARQVYIAFKSKE